MTKEKTIIDSVQVLLDSVNELVGSHRALLAATDEISGSVPRGTLVPLLGPLARAIEASSHINDALSVISGTHLVKLLKLPRAVAVLTQCAFGEGSAWSDEDSQAQERERRSQATRAAQAKVFDLIGVEPIAMPPEGGWLVPSCFEEDGG